MANKETFEIDLKDKFSKALGKADKKLEAFRKKQEQVKSTSISKAAGKLGLGDTLGFASLGGFGLAAGAVAGIGAAVGDAIGTFRSFQKEMSKVGAFAKASASDLELLKDEAIRLGGATMFTATQAAQGMQELAKTGLSTRQIIVGMGDVLNFAAATNLELASASDIASNVMTQFGLKASEMTRIVDVLSNTTVSNATNMTQLSEAMKFIGPIANSLNVSLEETAATMGVMADGNLKGSIAAQAFGSSLTRLAKPTKEMATEMNKLGLELFDSKGEFVGMVEMVKRLEKGYSKLTTKQQLASTKIIFGAEAVKNISVLLEQGSAKLEKFTEANLKAGGTSEEIARKMADNWDGDVRKMSSAWEKFTLNVTTGSNRLNDTLRGVTKSITSLIDKMSRSLEEADLADKLGLEGSLFSSGLSGVESGKSTFGGSFFEKMFRGDDQFSRRLVGESGLVDEFEKRQKRVNEAIADGEAEAKSLRSIFEQSLEDIDPFKTFRESRNFEDYQKRIGELGLGDQTRGEELFSREQLTRVKSLEFLIDSINKGIGSIKKDAVKVQGEGVTGGVAKDQITDATTKIRGEKTKIFNVNIGNLVEKLMFNKSSDSENELDMQRQITEILTRALNDAQTLAIGQG